MVTIQPVRDTQLFTITVEGSDPAQVRDIANTVAAVFIQQQNQRLAQSQATNTVSVAQPALVPLRPTGPRLWLNTALAAVVGLLLVLGVVFLLEYLDDTVKTPEDLDQAVALPVLGTVMRFSTGDGVHPLGLLLDPEGGQTPVAEAYRLLRTNLAFSALERPVRTLVVTSAGPGEGKSTTVANLALVMAQAGQRVVVVDADLRRPSLHRFFELENRQGLTNLLLEQEQKGKAASLADYLQRGPVAQVQVLPSGPLPPNPAELLQSPQFAALLERLQDEADVVIIDSPPVLAVADALLVAQRADSTLLVVDTGHTRADTLRQAVAALQPSGTRIVGAVLNKLSRRAGGYYYRHYYYYRGYGQYGGYGQQRDGRNGTKPSAAERSAEREQHRVE